MFTPFLTLSLPFLLRRHSEITSKSAKFELIKGGESERRVGSGGVGRAGEGADPLRFRNEHVKRFLKKIKKMRGIESRFVIK